MSEALTLIKCIPVLLGLIKSIKAGILKYETEKSVADHLAQVKNAFDTGNTSELNSVFNGVPDTPTAEPAN